MCSFILHKDYAVEIRLNLIEHNRLTYMCLIYTQQKKNGFTQNSILH